MKLSKNDDIKLNIDSLTSEGSGIGRYDGFAVFVRGVVPGDEITAHIIKCSKNYAIAIVKDIIKPSKCRIESDCPVSDKCGGCSFRNVSYDEELKYKRTRVNDALERIGKLDIEVEEIIGADCTQNYRNKAQYPVSICDGELFAGFYAYKSHRIICCDDCKLQPIEFKAGLDAFRIWAEKADITSYDENTGKGLLRHIYFRKGFATGDIMACAVINSGKLPQSELLVSLLKEKVAGLKSVVININREKSNVILGKESKTLWGDDYISDELLGKKFVISPNSFYQVNHAQCEKLYSKARDYANLGGDEILLDLYCGVGIIGLTMADRIKQLVGIEIIPQAIENAKINAKLNNIDNAKFICADAPKGAEILKSEGIKPDVIILDPPRKGCAPSLFDTVCQMNPKRIVYVSCDSSTLARDLKILEDVIEYVQTLGFSDEDIINYCNADDEIEVDEDDFDLTVKSALDYITEITADKMLEEFSADDIFDLMFTATYAFEQDFTFDFEDYDEMQAFIDTNHDQLDNYKEEYPSVMNWIEAGMIC